MGHSKVSLGVMATVLTWGWFVHLAAPSLSGRAADAVTLSERSSYPCDDAASARTQITLDNLRPQPVHGQLILLSNRYRQTALSYPLPDWKLLRVLARLTTIRDLYPEVDSFLGYISAEIYQDILTLEQNCKTYILGRRVVA
ncbi:uncharacterized protein LOC110980769 [Acanthaster planci]|uniref:Uncharacterized protein LOC110980769 n=1 Tax=Acanthaster planci TaxID=133434 RepID=A0A8B7YJJ2_ACAPL|nr:uncharacterized protein LOC110980769 [Acanthaster planci]